MKKKILCFIMATLMLLLTIPFSALKVEAAEHTPRVRINSQFYSDNSAGYRVYPDFDGNFILTISVDYTEDIDEDIVVYYRTEDDTAVAEWGDYEPVGVYEDAKITLTKANGYKAVVKISSKLLDYALQINHKSFQSATYGSRRFLFKILKIEGANAEAYAFSREFYCYLRANTYFNSDFYAQLTTKTHLKPAMYWNLEEYIAKKGTATKEFDLSTKIPTEWKDLIDKGIFNLGVSVNGDAYEKYWQSDGDTTLTMYYRIGEKTYPAFSLCIEGEFDECTYYGIEAAYYYLHDEDFLRYLESDCDVDDFWKDNFRGFTLYGNGGEKIYELYIDKKRSNRDAVGQELLRLETDPYMTILDSGRGSNHQHGYYLYDLHFLKMPSDYLKADSYYVEFASDTDHSDYKRRIRVSIDLALTANENPTLLTDEKGNKMVTTNINQIKEGDTTLKMMMRFNQYVYSDYYDKVSVTAKVKATKLVDGKNTNIEVPITMHVKNDFYYNTYDYDLFKYATRKYAFDTMMFECDIPEDLKNAKITSVTDITVNQSGGELRGFGNKLAARGLNKIYDLTNIYESDSRTPVATVNIKSMDQEKWKNHQTVDISVVPKESTNSAELFRDYVTIYYQWSNSNKRPDTYDNKVVLHTAADGERLKSTVGTGNGEMYLHLMAVSRYGKVSISDAKTNTYDPTDENAVYTPFGPYYFDNSPPEFSVDDIEFGGSLKEHTLTFELPDADISKGIGLERMELYFIPRYSENGEGVMLNNGKGITPSDFKLDPTTGKMIYTFKIPHQDVGVGVDKEGKTEDKDGNPILDREEIEFYWILIDKLGNRTGKTASFSLIFDTNDYIDGEIATVGAFDTSTIEFKKLTEKIDSLTFIYNYKPNANSNFIPYGESDKNVYYAFAFTLKEENAFGQADAGVYDANITYKGVALEDSDYSVVSDGNHRVVLFHKEISSGLYSIQLTRTENSSTRVSQKYSLYATNDQKDATEVQITVEKKGTLLNNYVYQLGTDFFYKDENGAIQKVPYNDTKQPASFSTFSKAKEYVYYKELSDIYLVEINNAMATALNSNSVGYYKAQGEESTTARAGQFWIRYKSETWTQTSDASSWVYYYYGTDSTLSEGNLSSNLLRALNTVSNRITGYGKEVVLTDASFILSSSGVTDKKLDKYGMPYLEPGQLHIDDEMSESTMCGNKWYSSVAYTADQNIYRSYVSVGSNDQADSYYEYPIVGNFKISESSIFQYMTYEQYKDYEDLKAPADWKTFEMDTKKDESFIHYFTTSGVYYIRELSTVGVSIYAIYIDKEAPKVNFYKQLEDGKKEKFDIDGVKILDINTSNLYIGRISDKELDRLAYVAVYKVSDLSLVKIYTAGDLDLSDAKLDDGNYYIVVSDRSGNHYVVTAKVNNSDMQCELKETANKFIRLTCNRRKDQIVRYEVYLNGELLTSTYSEDKTFEQAGIYTIYIQDIYGGVFSKEHVFNRTYPTVTWKYLGSDGKFYTYDPKNPQPSESSRFTITEISENQHKISTAVKTRFTFTENYAYEFIGNEPKYTETLSTETVVTIEAGQSFTLKVYYKSHKNCYTIYTGVVDVTPPTISVSADIDVLANAERDLFSTWANGSAGDTVKMEKLYYVLSSVSHKNIQNKGTVSSDIIKISADDANELSLIEVYLDGSLIKKIARDPKKEHNEFPQIVVSKWGNYRIVAKDTLGNVSEFTFINGKTDGLKYFVDGAEKEIDLHGYLNFDDNHVYTKVNYGKKDFKIDIRQNADVFISVGLTDDKNEIFGFRIVDGCIYELKYKIVLGKDNLNTIKLDDEKMILDINAEDFSTKGEYLIAKNGTCEIYASVDASKVVGIKAYAPKDTSKSLSVNARVELAEDDTTFFVSSEISQKTSNIAFKDSGIQKTTDIRINNGFTIDESFFKSERIESVSVYYSKLNDLDPTKLSGRKNIYAKNTQYSDEGFYLIIVKNLYGNETVYRISISKTFGITSSVTFADGHKIYYSKEYNDKLYSNSEITLDILSDEIVYKVTLNGSAYTGYTLKKQENITYLTFSKAGNYEVTLTDSYGNSVTRKLEINKSAYTVDDNLLTGYNEKALKRKEGYTNQKLSINKTVFDNSEIYYLAIKYKDTTTVLFDAFSETPVSTKAEDLVNIIGAQGDGVYTVICRNRYGAIVTKDINYRSTPTLVLERTIRSKSEPEVYDLKSAISLGFWSNNSLIFKTDAITYKFTINGNVTECPKTLMFDASSEYGSSEYEITYIDEYGFEYTFKAYLVRKEITINVPSSITGIDVDGVLNTKNDISITFGNNIYATYTRNNGEEVAYKSGDVLKKDGTYKFIVSDYAGNVSTITLKKDTIVEFAFVETNTSATIQNGAVVNSSKVSLDILNKDSVYIEKVLKNGVVQTDFSGDKFAEDGKWELILSDKLGNKEYFSFYIVTRSQNGFAYTTPYEYRITEMWYDNGDGVKVSYLSFVTHTDTSSSFSFKENGKYTVVMTSIVSGETYDFEFTVNTSAPKVSLLGCNAGDTTINDVSLSGCQIGDLIKIYKTTDRGEELVQEITVTSLATKMPTITEGGKYRIVVASEAGVETELNFVRKHVMNTAGSIFILVIIAIAVIGLFAGLIYRNKSKTDE